MKSKVVWGIIGGLLLAALSIYVVLDTFVIERTYIPVDTSSQTANAGQGNSGATENSDGTNASVSDDVGVGNPNAVITENSYEDDNISIVLTKYRKYDTNIYVADVKLSSPEYLKTAFAKGAFGHNIKAETSETAKNVHAILAINGDYYSVRETGYVVRNGVLYRNTSSEKEILAIYKDGSFAMFKGDEISAEQLMADGAEQVLCFGPAIVKGGEIAVPERETAKNPRTAIGRIDDLHYVFVATDGRVDDSEGLSYYELAEFVHSLGVKEGYNLDGGGSTAMYFNGQTVNNTPRDSERQVSDIVYIGY